MPDRAGSRRRYLMCRPTHFDVTYSINPWMNPTKPVDTALAVAQWERLREVYTGLGHRVDLIDPEPGLPDMVFAANAATVIDGRVLLARFRYPQRAAEADAYLTWFADRGHPVSRPEHVNEGQGDYLFDGVRILAGTGFRTEPESHAEAGALFGYEVESLTLVDPRFYHLDTALAVLGPGEIMYHPPAFAPESAATLARLYPDAIVVDAAGALAFGLNAVSDGHHVVLPHTATGVIEQLRGRGYEPVGVDVSELHRSGGAVKCCTLELHGLPDAPEGEP